MGANEKYFFSKHEENMGQIMCCCGYLAEAIQDIEQARFDTYTTYLLQILHANNKFLSPASNTNAPALYTRLSPSVNAPV